MRILRLLTAGVWLVASAVSVIPAQAQSPQRWAAVAVSTHPGKDAYAFQYAKDSEAGAIQDVVAICERILAERGFRDGRCIARASTNWVIGMYCRQGRSTIGVGNTPAEAAMDALSQATDSRGCDFKALRHATIDRTIIRDDQWTVTLECQGRLVPGIGVRGTDANNAAVIALNQAFLNCGGSPFGIRIAQFDTNQRYGALRQ